MNKHFLHQGLSPDLFQGEDDINNLPLEERIKQLTLSLLEKQENSGTLNPTDITNIEKSLNFTFAVVDNILQEYLRDIFPNIKTPEICIGEGSKYFQRHEIQIGLSDVDADNIDLLVVIAHEYGHAIIYELIRQRFLPKEPETKYQEQFCDFIAGYCLGQYHKKFEGVYDDQDYKAGKKAMKKFGDSSEICSILSNLNPIFLDKLMFPEYRNKPIVSKNEHGTGLQRQERFEKGYNSDRDGLLTAFMKLVTLPDSERMKKIFYEKRPF